MADRLYTFTSNLVSFVAGERPSADKFNAANKFFSRSLRDVSKAIGDIYNQGYPHLGEYEKETNLTSKWNPYETGRREGRALDILNLARIIGPASNLNPKTLSGASNIEETIPNGVGEYQLKYPVLSPSGIIVGYDRVYDEGQNFELEKQFKIVKNSVIFSKKTTEETIINYLTNSDLYHGGANYYGASFNVIPDPNQNEKLIVTEIDGEYIVDLGNITNQQSGLEDLASSTLSTKDINLNKQAKLPTWMWQTEDGEALFEEGMVIPEGLVYLKCLTSNEAYLSANYIYLSPTQIKVTGVSLCIEDEFQLIVVGTDITTSIDDIRNKLFLHKHDGAFGEPRISVKDLVGKFINGEFGESSINDNDFPMYLHRKGYQTDSNNMNGDNSMLGPLVMARASFDPFDVNEPVLNKISNNNLSEKVIFGNQGTGIYRNETGNLVIENLPSGNAQLVEYEKIKIVGAEVETNAASTNIVNSLYSDFNVARENTHTQEKFFINSKLETSENAYLNQRFIVEEQNFVTGEYSIDSNEITVAGDFAKVKEEGYSSILEIGPSLEQSYWVPSRSLIDQTASQIQQSIEPDEKGYFITPFLGLKKIKISKNGAVEETYIDQLPTVSYTNNDAQLKDLRYWKIPFIEGKTLYSLKTNQEINSSNIDLNKAGLWDNSSVSEKVTKSNIYKIGLGSKLHTTNTCSILDSGDFAYGSTNPVEIQGKLVFPPIKRNQGEYLGGTDEKFISFKYNLSTYFKELLNEGSNAYRIESPSNAYLKFLANGSDDSSLGENYFPLEMLSGGTTVTDENAMVQSKFLSFYRKHITLRVKDLISGEISWLKGPEANTNWIVEDLSDVEAATNLGTEIDFYFKKILDSGGVYDADTEAERTYLALHFRPNLKRLLCESLEDFQNKVNNDQLEIAIFWGFFNSFDTSASPTKTIFSEDDDGINTYYYHLSMSDGSLNNINLDGSTPSSKSDMSHSPLAMFRGDNQDILSNHGVAVFSTINTATQGNSAWQFRNYNNLGQNKSYIEIVREINSLKNSTAGIRKRNFTIACVNEDENEAAIKYAGESFYTDEALTNSGRRSAYISSMYNIILNYQDDNFSNINRLIDPIEDQMNFEDNSLNLKIVLNFKDELQKTFTNVNAFNLSREIDKYIKTNVVNQFYNGQPYEPLSTTDEDVFRNNFAKKELQYARRDYYFNPGWTSVANETERGDLFNVNNNVDVAIYSQSCMGIDFVLEIEEVYNTYTNILTLNVTPQLFYKKLDTSKTGFGTNTDEVIFHHIVERN